MARLKNNPLVILHLLIMLGVILTGVILTAS